MDEDMLPAYRFYVEIDGHAQAVFTEVSGLQVETVVMDYEEGGNNGFVHRRPGRTKVSNLTLKHGMTGSHDFFSWYMDFLGGQIKPLNISVVMYNTKGDEMVRWDFLKAFPVKWVGPQLAADSKNSAIETLELAHQGVQIIKNKKTP